MVKRWGPTLAPSLLEGTEKTNERLNWALKPRSAQSLKHLAHPILAQQEPKELCSAQALKRSTDLTLADQEPTGACSAQALEHLAHPILAVLEPRESMMVLVSVLKPE